MITLKTEQDIRECLLKLWKENDIKYLYKYKHMVKEATDGGGYNTELFHDLNQRIFKQVPDLADYPIGTRVDEIKIPIEDVL